MKPDEIKRCLESCAGGDCEDCIYKGETACTEYLKSDVIAYINELETGNKAMHKLLEEKRNAKAEAIKEFADGLKAKAQNATTWTGIEPVVTISDIEDTAKKMVGDEVV